MIAYILIFCGLGALLRYTFSKLNRQTSLPLGTLAVNLLGAFLIGYFYGHIADKQVYTVLSAGFCGGLTTFSTFQAEVQALLEDKKKALLYLCLTVGLGFLAMILGILL